MSMIRKKNAWWVGTADNLLLEEPESVVAQLAAAGSDRHLPPKPEQMESWRVTIQVLRDAISGINGSLVGAGELGIVLEFEIPRRARRIDVVLVARHTVLVIEMKVGASAFDRASQIQAIDYALDLLDFHSESVGRRVVPILVATAAVKDGPPADPLRGSLAVRNLSSKSLGRVINEFLAEDEMVGNQGVLSWVGGSYMPTPSILEAARQVFEGHNVAEISKANANNLTETVETIAGAIAKARSENLKVICFVTGIPGSGKTLTGLSAAHMSDGTMENPGFSYLSGNGPLVDVLRYAIARDRVRREPKISMEEAERQSTVFIQHVRDFLDHYLNDPRPPSENVIVFDEAQRAWDAQQMKNKSRSGVEMSQAQIALRTMERRPDWAVIVALVGNGQEINRGEAGIGEWFRALEESPDWSVWVAKETIELVPDGLRSRAEVKENLHLDVVTRAPRGGKLAEWVDALLRNELTIARQISEEIDNFPLLMTRDLDEARKFIRDCASEDQRVGVVATSQDRRLRAFGIERSTAFIRSIKWPQWFVHGSEDTRSSYSLEVAASEFECQGLEIDWSLVCWGADLVPDGASWMGRRFKGDKWQVDNDSTMAVNRYRVLLTRARKGMVIWVPDTGGRDILKVDNQLFARIASTLQSAGVKPM
jgi:hypothetical protein